MYLSSLLILFFGLSIDVQTTKQSSFILLPKNEELTINQNKIEQNGNLIARYQVLKKEIKASKKEKIENYDVKIFCKEGSIIADYEITINWNERNHKTYILDAHINTVKDRVTHNGANFLDYNASDNLKVVGAPQFKKAIKYLLALNYL